MPMPPISTRPAVAISLLALVLAACGNSAPSDSASSAPASEPTREAAASAEASASESDPLAALSEFVPPTTLPPIPGETLKIEKDRKNWILPTDKYFVFDNVKRDKAERKKVISCLDEAGIKSDFPEIDESPDAVADLRRNTQAPLVHSEAHMEAVGYAKENVQGTNKAFKEAFFKLANEADPSQLDAIKKCTKAFYLEENVATPYGYDSYNDIGVEQTMGVQPTLVAFAQHLLTEEANKPEIQAIFDKWRACMAPTGADLANESPLSMPPASKSMEWDKALYDEKKPFFIPEDHLNFAKQDISCRESSGFYEAVYNLQWDYYEKHISEHKDYYDKAQIWHTSRNKDLDEFLKK